MKTQNSKPDYISTLKGEGFEVRANKISCPFHFPDKTPSFIIYPKTQTGHCFGCSWHGDIIAFIMQYKNLSFKDTLAYLGISGDVRKIKPPTENKKRRLLRAFKQWEKDYSDHVAMLLRGIRRIMAEGFKDIDEAENYAELFHALPVLEYYHEILYKRDDKAKHELFLEVGNEWL